MFFFVGVLALDDVAASMKPGSKALAFNHAFFALVPEPSIKTSVEAMSLAVLKTMAPNRPLKYQSRGSHPAS